MSPPNTDRPASMTNNKSDKNVVREYFNSTGFERWQKIYGKGPVNRVQQSIRTGHQQTVDTVLAWLGTDLTGISICDAGCGLGSLSLPLAERGAQVSGFDISEKMIGEAIEIRNAASPSTQNPHFEVREVEVIAGKYDVVICLDVLIHYPLEDVERMLAHLSGLSRSRLLLTFAPKTPFLTVLKKIGGLFPGASKTTRAYQHREKDILAILQKLGWTLSNRAAINDKFYFARLFEAKR
jgi:magnesium-protoporphyrin O-methyltransferase